MAHPYHQHREHQVAHRRVAISLKDHPPGAQRLNTGSAFSAVTSKSAASDHDADDGPSRSAPKRFARGGTVRKAEGGAAPGKLPTVQQLVATNRSRPVPSPADSAAAMKTIEEKLGKARGGSAFARGGKVKHGHQTNIAIVVPHRGAQQPMAGAPPVMAGAPMPGGPPMAGPPPGPGAGNPPGMPQGMPMHKRGGRVKKADGGSVNPLTAANDRRQQEKDDREGLTTRRILEDRGLVTPSKAGGGSISGEATKGNIAKWSKRASGNSYFRGGAASGVGREEKAASQKKRK